MEKINLREKLALFDTHWDPKIEGELIIVPRGVEHRPVAQREAHVLLFEPASTLNTGNAVTARTVARPERL